MSSTSISLELRFLRLPTKWSKHRGAVHHERGESLEYFYAPEIADNTDAQSVQDAWKIRNDFLRMEHSEEAALNFLTQVGVWNAVQGLQPQSDLPKTRVAGTFGYRAFRGFAAPLTLEELWDEQDAWKDLLRGPSKLREAKLRARFGPPSSKNENIYEHLKFAWAAELQNTLPVHLEWKQKPRAILQPITGRELLIATIWIDLVSGSPFQECQHCGTPFTWHRKRMYCPPYNSTGVSACAHVVAQRMYKKREDAKKRRARRLA